MTGSFVIESTDLTFGGVNLTLVDGSTLVASFQSGRFGAWQYNPKGGPEVDLNLVRQ